MPRDLFGDVVNPSIRMASRKWYTLPVTIAVHALILAAIIVVPLLATGVLPALPGPSIILIEVVAPEPPAGPPPPRPKTAPTVPSENPNAAPVTVPTGLAPDSGIVRDVANFVEGVVPGGLATPIEGAGIAVAPEPPPPPPVTKPIRVFGGITPPTKLKDVKPVYPLIAQQARVSGLVIIEAVIDVNGRVVDAKILRSIPLLDQAALDAVRQWQYTSTRLSGMPVPVVMTVTVQFTLQ